MKNICYIIQGERFLEAFAYAVQNPQEFNFYNVSSLTKTEQENIYEFCIVIKYKQNPNIKLFLEKFNLKLVE